MTLDPLTTHDLRRFVPALAGRRPAADDAERVDRIRALEAVKAAVSAAQAEEIAAFATSQECANVAAGLPAARRSQGVAAQVALALRTSHHRATREVGFARVLCSELPAAHAALRGGVGTQWRAVLLARETAVLSLPQRLQVDAEFGPQLGELGDRRLEQAVRRRAYELDPHAALARATRAAQDRRVSIRPAPDTMCVLSLTAPVAQGVAAYAALCRAADSVTARGDARGRGQIMADTLVERVTGQAGAPDVPVEIALVMPADTLLDAGSAPGEIAGHGPVPAGVARSLALGTGPRWLRRLYARPGRGDLVAMDSRRREFTAGQRRFVQLRDGACRDPWCDAPIRHVDHIRRHADGGPTSVVNAQGLCAAGNLAKEAPGWRHRAGPDGSVVTVTPTGHTYASPPLHRVHPGRCGRASRGRTLPSRGTRCL